ncbi:MAG: HNH endonuclease, partial [Clostridia bacterium]
MYNLNEIKKALLERDGEICSICGTKLDFDNISVDHIFPKGLGGGDDLNNLR